MTKYAFAPGCALFFYKPHLADKLYDFLKGELGEQPLVKTCCRNKPEGLCGATEIINVCSGCDKRYSSLYDDITTVSLWKLLAESSFDFPDYGGEKITVHDTCPTRHKTDVHEAVRALLTKMNFEIVEAERSGTSAFCCGDSLYPKSPKEKIYEQMKKRADSLPLENVAVYCVSCIKSIKNGGKSPRYMVDLLFGEPTVADETDPEIWHNNLKTFIETHMEQK